jgi:hypothetical protein
MTSMKEILDQQVDVAHVREQVATHFAHVFKLQWNDQKGELKG